MSDIQNERGFSLIELLIVVAIIMIIAAIAIPNLLKARISANEASAISSVRSITTAQICYRIYHPEIGYAADLVTLGPGGEKLVDVSIGAAPFQHSGYEFSTEGYADSFKAEGHPLAPGSSGRRNFCTDTPSDLYYSINPDPCVPKTSTPI